jgi:hypothetical protein
VGNFSRTLKLSTCHNLPFKVSQKLFFAFIDFQNFTKILQAVFQDNEILALSLGLVSYFSDFFQLLWAMFQGLEFFPSFFDLINSQIIPSLLCL